MIGTIRKHQQWMWIFIIAITIVTFVIWFSPDARWQSGASARTGDYAINGKPVLIEGRPISVDEFNKAVKETQLFYFLRSGGREWPGTDQNSWKNLERDAIYRLLLIKKLKDFDVHVSDTAVARAAVDRLGNFPLARFEEEYLRQHNLNAQDFERFLRHDLGIQQLINTAAVSAKLVDPSEAESLYRQENEQTLVDLCVFWSSNHLAQVAVTPDEVGKYYTNHMAEYRIPERTLVHYVAFAASNFLAEADKELLEITNLNARIDEYYLKRGTNLFKGTNDTILGEAEAKAKIKEDLRSERALLGARRKAAELGDELYNQPDPNKADNLEKLAAAKGLTLLTSPPFDRMTSLTNEGFPPEFQERAFKLTKEQPISVSPIVGENAVYLIALKGKEPSKLQALDEIRDRVSEDFRKFRALELARTAGTNFHATLTNGLAQKKSFDDLVTQAKVERMTLAPFSRGTTTLTNLDERLNFRMIQQIASNLKPGEASPYLATPFGKPAGGFILHLRDRRPAEESKMKTELAEFTNRIRSYRQSEAFNQWFRKQVELAKLVIPQAEEAISPPRPAAQ